MSSLGSVVSRLEGSDAMEAPQSNETCVSVIGATIRAVAS